MNSGFFFLFVCFFYTDWLLRWNIGVVPISLAFFFISINHAHTYKKEFLPAASKWVQWEHHWTCGGKVSKPLQGPSPQEPPWRSSLHQLPVSLCHPFHSFFSFLFNSFPSVSVPLNHDSIHWGIQVSAEGKWIWEQPIHSVAPGAAILLPDMTLPN